MHKQRVFAVEAVHPDGSRVLEEKIIFQNGVPMWSRVLKLLCGRVTVLPEDLEFTTFLVLCTVIWTCISSKMFM